MNENQTEFDFSQPKVKELPDAAYLNECLEYDPISGSLTWKHRPRSHFKSNLSFGMWNGHYAGKEAGRPVFRREGKKHAVFVKVGRCGMNNVYLAHRIIFAMLWIDVPEGMQIDHRDGDPHNNRQDNLRLATAFQNAVNRPAMRNKKEGLPKGAYKTNGGYQSWIRADGVEHYLGYFHTPEAAHSAYVSASKTLHGEFFCEPDRDSKQTLDEPKAQ